MLAIVFDLLFVPVLLGGIASYWRERGPVRRDVLLIFVAMAVFFLRDLARRTIGNLPEFPNDVATAVQIAQGWLTLVLIGRLRPVPKWLTRGAGAAYLATAVLIFALKSPLPLAGTIAVVASVALSGLGASILLAVDAHSRAGAARIRTTIAAAATGTFAIATVVNSAGAFHASLGNDARSAARVIGLVAALGFAAAFIPPHWLRRWWSISAAYNSSRFLLRVETNAPEHETWRRFARTVRDIRGADAALVLLPAPDGFIEVAGAGIEADLQTIHPAAQLEELFARRQPIQMHTPAADALSLAVEFAGRIDARYVTAIELETAPHTQGALLLLGRYRSLFMDDDLGLLAELGTQASLIAERRGVITKQKQLTVGLAATVDALTAADQAKTGFLTNMSHELRTPLNAIIGFSDLMKREPEVDEHTNVPSEWIEHVHASGRHLLELVNDLLDLAKVEAGRMDLRPERMDISVLVDGAVSTLRPLLLRKHLELESDIAPLTIEADRVRVRQILDNLLSNAIKFTPDGGRISIHASQDGETAVIAITDTGVGIAPADQGRVFDEFQQVGAPDAHVSGTGLGLALTRRLVEAHGGTIELESEVGSGTTITVRLPIADPSRVSVTVQDGPALGPTEGYGGILLIEDDPGAVRLLRTHLEAGGHHVTVATDGPGGLAVARRDQPAAIVLDVLLPGMDGWEVLRHLKQDPHVRDIPVVIVTIVDEQEIGMALGAADYFVKPIEPEALLARLARHAWVTPPLAPGSSGAAALAIDDDPMSLETIAAGLTRQGMNVRKANSAADGLRLARTEHFDLIVCDLLMPEVDGFSVIAELDADAATRNIPVLVVTAADLSDSDKSRLNGKILGIVHKGDELQDGLNRWLSQVAPKAEASVR